MEDIFDQITGTLDAGFPYASIVMAVAIPDICANLLLPPDAKAKANQKSRYQAWYRENLAAEFPNLTADDFYSLRCGVVHEGRFSNKDMKTFERVLFATGKDCFSVGTLSGVLMIETKDFCQRIVSATRSWLQIVEHDRNVQQNLERLVRPCLDGFPGLVRGIPLIG